MDAMNYEYLLRRVYNCGRHGAKGADADIYRRFERTERNLTNPHWGGTQEEKEHDYRTAFAEVRTYVRNAIKEGFKQVEHGLSSEEIKVLEDMQKKISGLEFYDKKRLEEMIRTADEIFRKHGLEAR